MTSVEAPRLGLRGVPVTRRYDRRPQALATEDDGIVEVDELDGVGELQFGKGKGEPAAAQQRGQESLPAEACELLDDGGQRAIGEIQYAEEVRVVVPALGLEHPRKPERTVGVPIARAVVPGEAAVEDHA